MDLLQKVGETELLQIIASTIFLLLFWTGTLLYFGYTHTKQRLQRLKNQ